MAPHVCTPEECGEFWKMWAKTIREAIANGEVEPLPDSEICDCNQEEVCRECGGWRS